MRTIIRGIGLGIGLSLLSGGATLAQDADVKIEIDKMSCREMLKMTGNDRLYTLLYFHGFVSGQSNNTLFDEAPLSEASDKIIETCIDSPEAMLLTVFQDARK